MARFCGKSWLWLCLQSLVLVSLVSALPQYDEEDDYEDANDTEEEGMITNLDTPEFVSSSGNVFVTPGERMRLVCQVNALSQFQMIWIKDKTDYLSIGANSRLTKDKRFHFRELDNNQGMSLTLDNFGPGDVGQYECQIASVPPQSIFYDVRVSSDDNDSNEIPKVVNSEDAVEVDESGPENKAVSNKPLVSMVLSVLVASLLY